MNGKVTKRIELFKKGFSIKEVSEITGDLYKTVEGTSRRYRKNGGKLIKLSNRKFVNDTYFDVIDSEKKAYILGFFLADGCIDGSKHRNDKFTNRLMVTNSIDDLEIIKEINKEICPNTKIYIRHNDLGVVCRKPQACIRWTSAHMTKTLMNKYDFRRQKAYEHDFKFPFNKMPKKYYRHFIRGFFDGDGNVDFAITLTVNGVETTRFQYGFVFNSPLLAKQFSDIICSITPGVSGTITEIKGKTTNWWNLRFNTYKIKSLDKRYLFYKYLYKNSNIYLKRKKIKFDSFFEYRGKELV